MVAKKVATKTKWLFDREDAPRQVEVYLVGGKAFLPSARNDQLARMINPSRLFDTRDAALVAAKSRPAWRRSYQNEITKGSAIVRDTVTRFYDSTGKHTTGGEVFFTEREALNRALKDVIEDEKHARAGLAAQTRKRGKLESRLRKIGAWKARTTKGRA